MIRRALITFLEALFRVLFTYDCRGEEHVPASGPAVVAANHPSYLDPVLLSLQVQRPIRFMAWDALFKVPGLGAVILSLGAFPVDIRRGKGREAYERARAIVERGDVVGIFPEGKRSTTAWMEPALREGAARLSWETGAPLVPATIAGAFRAWPHFRLLPSAVRIRVMFHEPIDPTPYRAQPEEEALPRLLDELRRRVERALLPGVRADRRFDALYRQPAMRPAAGEVLPHLVLGVLLARAGALAGLWLGLAQAAYVLLDAFVLPQSRRVKRLRQAMAPTVLAVQALGMRAAFGLPPLPAGGALGAILCGAAFPYLYERVPVARAFLRGMVAAVALDLAALAFSGQAVGSHLGLPLYAALYALSRRTVFHRWAVAVLAVYAVAIPYAAGAGLPVLAHAGAALVAWAAALAVPYDRGRPA
jgi:1-acyl-sn-glycerol-3-phosphate acyltransferase